MTPIERLGLLQDLFFQKTSDLYENIEPLGIEFYTIMLKDIMTIYEKEKNLLLKEFKIDYEATNYRLECQEDLKKPARCGLFWRRRNEPADLIYREVYAQVQANFNKRIQTIEFLEAQFEATENAVQTDEPQEPTQCNDGHKRKIEKQQQPADGDTSLTVKKKTVKP